MKALSLLAVLLCAPATLAAAEAVLDEAGLAWVGERIFANECASRLECLTSWNEGEDFPSLGLGHFIWYRQGQEAAFSETFPGLLRFLEDRGVALPAWIRESGYASPWPDRAAFEADPRRGELLALLQATMPLQVAFIMRRFEGALARVLAAAEPERRAELEARFHAVARAHPPRGAYALIDYVNFKGEGSAESERYRGQGWGLRQVLEGMRGEGDPLNDFAASAREVLAIRVRNAPPERGEQRWLAGWHRRVDTYLPPSP